MSRSIARPHLSYDRTPTRTRRTHCTMPTRTNKQAKVETVLERVLREAGIVDQPNTAQSLRRQAESIVRRASAALAGIPMGQPIVSRADRNRRERSADLMRKAVELFKKAELMEQKQGHTTSPG